MYAHKLLGMYRSSAAVEITKAVSSASALFDKSMPLFHDDASEFDRYVVSIAWYNLPCWIVRDALRLDGCHALDSLLLLKTHVSRNSPY